MVRLLRASRFLIVLAVIDSLILAAAVTVASMIETFVDLARLFPLVFSDGAAKKIAVVGIEIVDLLLIATVLYIIATGLYELFIGDIPGLPSWITITSLDDLKNKLISVVVAVLSVTFLIQVVNWNGQTNLFFFGAAIGVVVLALTAFRFVEAWSYTKKQKPSDNGDGT